MPPWPVRSSTTNCVPRWLPSQSPKMRAVVSLGPPAAKPTIQWIGRLGYLSAARTPNVIADMPIRATSRADRRATRICTSPWNYAAGSVIDLGGRGKTDMAGLRHRGADRPPRGGRVVAPWPHRFVPLVERDAAGSRPIPPRFPMTRKRIVPLIVAVALFMENMDSTVIATSLPAIAADIGTSPLALKLAVTSYLLSLAVFIPMSGWTADRFGARKVFATAIAVFVLGSIGCAIASSLTDFVIARIVQGMGGAMMTPVGRLVLVRSVDKRALVDAMALVSMPAMLGPITGPPLDGFLTTYASWHWIFIINVPIGLLGIVLVLRYIEDVRMPMRDPFDLIGMVLAAISVAGLAFGCSVLGVGVVPLPLAASLIAIGAVAFAFYLRHARKVPAPVLDFSLLALPTVE